MKTLRQIPLAPLTTLQLGGPAEHLVRIEREDDLNEWFQTRAQRTATENRFFVLGGGSNIVIPDAGFAGTVLQMAIGGITLSPEGLEAGAGENWDKLVARSVTDGWSGLESLSGIPGQVGASPVQNIGAYGYEVAPLISGVRAFDTEQGAFVDFLPNECGFTYRSSLFKGRSRWIVTRVRFRLAQNHGLGAIRYAEVARELNLPKGSLAPIADLRQAVLNIRRRKSMLQDPADPDSRSAGSFMTNPLLTEAEFEALRQRAGETLPHHREPDGRYKVPAAWLIEQAGFHRGLKRGGVGISSKHCLALINLGHGTARELLSLANDIRAAVRERFGVALELEPVVIV